MRRLTLAMIVGTLAGAAQAQTSPLYLTDWQTSQAFVVQGGKIINQFSTGAYETAIAVADTVRIMGGDPGYSGSEYSLAGGLLQKGVYPNPGFAGCWDGTTDGSSANYSIAHNDFGSNFSVFKFDRNWSGAKVLFTPSSRSSGITYDGTDGTFWTTETTGSGTGVSHYDASGNRLGGFSMSIPGAYGIALDAADGTLWIPESFGSPRIHQFNKSGTLLQSLTVSGLSSGLLGAEFSVIPAPGAAAVIGLGALAAARRRRV